MLYKRRAMIYYIRVFIWVGSVQLGPAHIEPVELRLNRVGSCEVPSVYELAAESLGEPSSNRVGP